MIDIVFTKAAKNASEPTMMQTRTAAIDSPTNYIPATTLAAKRCFDIAVSLLGLALSAPVWPLLILAIRLDSKGPALFRQLRVGRATPTYTELFYMIKFRTMRVDAEKETGAVWATRNDPRVTRVGRFLRKTRLDELPQLLNVLRGEMSIVGPRPERPGISNNLDRAIPYYIERTYFVTPGITGMAQVRQGYDACLEDVKNKIGYDHAYSLCLSSFSSWLKTDIEIILLTFWVMIRGRGQ
ncbi:sugar transferase [Hahella sp. HN01]|uniref:sugar transferase n=1 Tax=Hahella sp. HN01 TaxID=2847262 RepID=UPI0020A6CB9B|nr:sugar transferase [Hahella sp. HN01]